MLCRSHQSFDVREAIFFYDYSCYDISDNFVLHLKTASIMVYIYLMLNTCDVLKSLKIISNKHILKFKDLLIVKKIFFKLLKIQHLTNIH